MTKEQAGGYIFEFLILELLKKHKYIKVKQKNLKGRGAIHQIDATGIFYFPTPFVYPIRLICEAKYYNASVGLPEIRNFLGALKDIAENYFIKNSSERRSQRFNDVGCFFCKDEFTKDAQNYAWAQNIFLVSFHGISGFEFITNEIHSFLNTTITENNLEQMDKTTLLTKFKASENNIFKKSFKKTELIVATLNRKYPVMFISKNGLLEKLQNLAKQEDYDLINATKTSRIFNDDKLSIIFRLTILNEEVELSLPNFIAEVIVDKISKSVNGQEIFELDIPVVVMKNENLIRRIFNIKTILS